MANKPKRTRRYYRSYEFRPDALQATFLKTLHLTQLQRKILLKWTLFALVWILALTIQDVLMAQVNIFGGTTDLVPCFVLLTAVTIGSEQGSVFALVAALFYHFSGSAPGPYAVALIPLFGIAGALFRENFWRRGFASDTLCAAIAMMLYEISVFGFGTFSGLTGWYRFGVFLVTGLLSVLVMLPLYPLVSKIGAIGGETWKE